MHQFQLLLEISGDCLHENAKHQTVLVNPLIVIQFNVFLNKLSVHLILNVRALSISTNDVWNDTETC